MIGMKKAFASVFLFFREKSGQTLQDKFSLSNVFKTVVLNSFVRSKLSG